MADIRASLVKMDPVVFSACGFILGIVSHLAYFIHGEHHMLAYQYFLASIMLPTAMATGLVFCGSNVIEAIKTVLEATTSYALGLFLSILIYRGLFHRLRSFPGPPLAKFTKLWHVWIASKNLRNFEEMDNLHAKYGTFVRIGKAYSSIGGPSLTRGTDNRPK